MKKEIIKYIAILVAFLLGAMIVWFVVPPDYTVIREKVKWNGERYVGWDMPCNYAYKSDKEDQQYLDCGNGNLYKKIGTSPSITWFNPNDEGLNRSYCKDEDEVATFTYPNPITHRPGNEFVDCIKW